MSVARSGSSGSSRSGNENISGGNKRFNDDSRTSHRADNDTGNFASGDDSSSNAEEEETLLASFLNSGICKSKSDTRQLLPAERNNRASLKAPIWL